MYRPSVVSFCVLCFSILVQPANAQEKTWQKYDLKSITIPPPNVVYDNARMSNMSMETFDRDNLVAKLVQRGVTGSKTTIVTKNSLSVKGTPDIHQQVTDNIAYLQRPETKNARFVMAIDCLTLGYSNFITLGYPDKSTNVLWQEKHYGLLSIGTGYGRPPQKIEDGVELPVMPEVPIHEYLRPIQRQSNKTTHSGVSFYWVAKEDIPKMQEAWSMHVHKFKEDSRFRHHFRSQPVVTSNAQLGINMEDMSCPFTLSEKKWYKSSPAIENFFAQKVFTSVSVLSLDGKTVSSDVDMRFPIFPKRPPVKSVTEVLPVRTASPKMEEITISEENLTWPANGMLVVFMRGITLIADGEINKTVSGLPLLNKKVDYTLEKHEVQTLVGILTIRME